jgi:hypothetical protein
MAKKRKASLLVFEDWKAAMAALARIAEEVRAAITDMPLEEREKVEWLLENGEVLWAYQIVFEQGGHFLKKDIAMLKAIRELGGSS